jgi:hypothetical protein
MHRDNHRKIPDTTSNHEGGFKPLSKYGHNDFMKLASNSYKTKNYGRAIDNCRLAVEMAERVKDSKGMAEAYDLWISALMAENKYSAIKKLCCEARSKLGNYLDLTYYEFKATQQNGDPEIAKKLAAEYMDIKNKISVTKNTWGVKTINLTAEVQDYLDKQLSSGNQNEPNLEMEK